VKVKVRNILTGRELGDAASDAAEKPGSDLVLAPLDVNPHKDVRVQQGQGVDHVLPHRQVLRPQLGAHSQQNVVGDPVITCGKINQGE
jgi:hypothetical protein